MVLKSDYLMLTNGLNHFFVKWIFEKREYLFLPDLPNYNSQQMTSVAIAILNWNGENLLNVFSEWDATTVQEPLFT